MYFSILQTRKLSRSKYYRESRSKEELNIRFFGFLSRFAICEASRALYNVWITLCFRDRLSEIEDSSVKETSLRLQVDKSRFSGSYLQSDWIVNLRESASFHWKCLVGSELCIITVTSLVLAYFDTTLNILSSSNLFVSFNRIQFENSQYQNVAKHFRPH